MGLPRAESRPLEVTGQFQGGESELSTLDKKTQLFKGKCDIPESVNSQEYAESRRPFGLDSVEEAWYLKEFY